MALFSDIFPASGATSVARTTIISFKANDDANGIKINTLSVTVNSTAVITNNTFVNGYNGQVFAGTGHYLVGIYPKSPSFLPDSSQIDVVLSVRDGSDNLVIESYSFYTTNYGSSTTVPSTGVFGCTNNLPRFGPTDAGLTAALNNDVGTEVVLQWNTAVAYDSSNTVFYNVYYNTLRRNLLDSDPVFIATARSIRIGGLRPGDTHFFLVRAAEFDTSVMNVPTGMRMAGSNLFFYPSGVILRSAITKTDLTIPVTSVSGFPASGVIRINKEWIYYSSIQTSPPAFITTLLGRGYGDSIAAVHSSGDSVKLWNGLEDENTTITQATPAWEKPNFAQTWVLTDGYGYDGYRDGYDGYDSYYSRGAGANQNLDGVDGYWRYHREPIDSLNTDLTNNDNSGDFPSMDYCRTYRTKSPASFWKGQGSGTYFGGLQWRDGYMIQETNVRNHMLQREELLLETTGEPMVLLRRAWTGIRCFCFRQRREHPDARCPTCFIPGTLVRTINGFRPIENIKIGEKVLTSRGTYKKVISVFEKEYDGYLNKIKTGINSDYIYTTPEHPFMTLRGNHQEKIKRKCGPKCDNFINSKIKITTPKKLSSGNYWARVTDNYGNRISLGTFKTLEDADCSIFNYQQDKRKKLHTLKWDNAKNIKKGDWLVQKSNSNICDIGYINIPSKYKKNTKLGSQRIGVEKFTLDKEFLWIVGIYLAEGSSSKRSINFSLHKKEKIFQNRIINFFSNAGYNPKSSHKSENGVNIEVNSTTLAQWFPKWLGHLCYNKKIPEELMSLPKEKLISLLSGIYDGDGNKTSNDFEIGQTSKILALQIVELLYKIGKQPLLRTQKSNKKTEIGNMRKLCYIVSWEKDDFKHNNRKDRWKFENELLTKVTDVEKEYYNGKVYNLEVAGDHTYNVEGIVVHNCFGTGFQGGYTQFLNTRRSDRRILVRVDPTTEDLEIGDKSGLDPLYEPNAWTLPFPGLRDRDILIRFNENNTEEFRYEVLNVQRNRAFFGQSGAQKFQMKRLAKTDIIYQYLAQRDVSSYPTNRNTSVSSARGIAAHSHSIVLKPGRPLSGYDGMTTRVNGHSHTIIDGQIQSILGHTHTIL